MLFGGFFALREDDLIHKEEDHHGDAAVEHGGADVVDEVRHQQASHRHPHTVQLLRGAEDLGIGLGYVDLHDLGTLTVAGVGHGQAYALGRGFYVSIYDC